MAPPILLDANNSSQVSSPNIIEVDFAGQPGQKTLIISGIACPEWEVTDDDHLYNQSVEINLRQTVLAVVQSTVSIGLASIGNKNTAFQFACDSTDLRADSVTQELKLTASLALKGDWSILNRFGYQVVALVTTQATGITGTIRWDGELFNPDWLPPGELASLFLITANTVSSMAGGPFGGPTVYSPVAAGVSTGISTEGADFVATYKIPGGPYNQPLVVLVSPSSFFKTANASYVAQVGGPNPVILTVAQPGVNGVDFELRAIGIK